MNDGQWKSAVRGAPVTAALTVICMGVHLATVALAVELDGFALPGALWSVGGASGALEGVGALVAGRVWVDGEWWRVATTGVVHGSLVHLGLNLWSLWVVGPWSEAAFGRAGTAAIWLASSVLGVLASLAWAEAPVVVGASAGILGLAGALLAGRWLGRSRVSDALVELSTPGLVLALALLVALGAFVPVIAQAGHLGGLVGGLLLGSLSSASWGLRWGSGLGFLACVLGVGELAAAPAGRPGYHATVGFRLLEQNEMEGALRHLERALELDPTSDEMANAVAYALALRGVQLDRALELVNSALEAQPESADYLDTLGWIHCQAGRIEAGRAALARAEAAAGREIPEISEHFASCDKP